MLAHVSGPVSLRAPKYMVLRRVILALKHHACSSITFAKLSVFTRDVPVRTSRVLVRPTSITTPTQSLSTFLFALFGGFFMHYSKSIGFLTILAAFVIDVAFQMCRFAKALQGY